MSDFNRGFGRTVPPSPRGGAVADMGVDAGLRSFMLGVYNKMALGLVLSGALAWLTASYPPVRDALYVVTPDGRLAGLRAAGVDEGTAHFVVALEGNTRDGLLAETTGDLARLIGRPTTPLVDGLRAAV